MLYVQLTLFLFYTDAICTINFISLFYTDVICTISFIFPQTY